MIDRLSASYAPRTPASTPQRYTFYKVQVWCSRIPAWRDLSVGGNAILFTDREVLEQRLRRFPLSLPFRIITLPL